MFLLEPSPSNAFGIITYVSGFFVILWMLYFPLKCFKDSLTKAELQLKKTIYRICSWWYLSIIFDLSLGRNSPFLSSYYMVTKAFRDWRKPMIFSQTKAPLPRKGVQVDMHTFRDSHPCGNINGHEETHISIFKVWWYS